MDKYYSIMWICHFFKNSFIDWSVFGIISNSLSYFENAALNVVCKCLCGIVFISLELIPKWMLGHAVTLYLTIWGIARLFSKVVATFSISTSSALSFPVFPLPCQHLLSDFLIQAIILCEVVSHCNFFFQVFWLHCTADLCSQQGIEFLLPREAQDHLCFLITDHQESPSYCNFDWYLPLITNDGYMLFNDHRNKWNNLLNVMYP